MKLIFINELGPDFRGNHIYEFIFSDTEIDLWGEEWEATPAAGRPFPPDLKYVKRVGRTFKEGMELELGKNSDYFSMEDILALQFSPVRAISMTSAIVLICSIVFSNCLAFFSSTLKSMHAGLP